MRNVNKNYHINSLNERKIPNFSPIICFALIFLSQTVNIDIIFHCKDAYFALCQEGKKNAKKTSPNGYKNKPTKLTISQSSDMPNAGINKYADKECLPNSITGASHLGGVLRLSLEVLSR